MILILVLHTLTHCLVVHTIGLHHMQEGWQHFVALAVGLHAKVIAQDLKTLKGDQGMSCEFVFYLTPYLNVAT